MITDKVTMRNGKSSGKIEGEDAMNNFFNKWGFFRNNHTGFYLLTT